MPRSARHTMGGREVLDAKTMLDLLEGSASDGGPTVTIDVDVFKDNFGAPPPPRSSLSGGRRSSSSGASRRRETADPAQLKELLQACLLEGNDAAAAASPTSQPPRPAPRRSPRFAKPRRRMTCDPRLLNRLVMEHSGEIPTIPEETSATESLTSNPYRGGVVDGAFRPIGATVARQIPVLKVTRSNRVSVTLVPRTRRRWYTHRHAATPSRRP